MRRLRVPAQVNEYTRLSDEQLLGLLATEEDRLPRAAVDQFLARADRMVEPLTRIVIAEENWYDEGSSYWRPVHATFILGAIGGEKAIPGLIGALRCAADPDFEVDWACDELPHIFAKIGPPAIRPLLDRAAEADPESPERMLAFESLASIAERHPDRRTEILDALRVVAGSVNEPKEARLSAGVELLGFALPQDRELLLALGRLPGSILTPSMVRQAYESTPRTPPPPRDWLNFYSPEEARHREKLWAEAEEAMMESGEEDEDFEEVPPDEELLAGLNDPAGAAGSGPAKTGRNDPCPCGSGKKFKKCCEP